MRNSDPHREPCPDRIIDDAGGAFGVGALGGSILHFLKGMRSSPRGERFIGGVQLMRMNAPKTAGRFGAWGAMFSAMDCACVYLRQKEDPWNSILAGAAAGGLLSLRQGLLPVAKSAVSGAVILALVEGLNIMMNESAGQMQLEFMNRQAQEMNGDVDRNAENGETPSSWFGGVFGRRKEEEMARKESETVVLESFDAPPPPSFRT